ncbi:dephospho-CoA kinase [Symbiobacterium terraclitae]|uniref:Dephospho-CoA kinase n=1 Tax=Symbiobacterium terraclitae TaxID=557451 RepID=A0ABS4JQD8_9FIRM|nr:dephospho-CoA kinase [Symbiobacterium terraclitae]MBP2017748.1 dephospho-CoA kinase [Symbiobacterium terraclitae]
MRIIGLTGSIASGKSTVTAILREIGAPVIDADAIVHELQQPGTEVTAAIAREFGPGVLRPDGSLDRAALGRMVFADPERRRALEAIVHPAVRAEMLRRVEALRREGRPAAVLDIPLLYESGWDRLVDEVWVVYVDRATQKARLIARSGLSPEEAEARIAAQGDLEEKARRADRVIDNRGGLAETRAQVLAAWQAVLGDADGVGSGEGG